MSRDWKKLTAMLAAGAFLVGGATLLWPDMPTASAQADRAERRADDMRGGRHDYQGRHGYERGHRGYGLRGGWAQEQISPREMSERMGRTFGLDPAEILDAQNDGRDMRDLVHAAFVAKASGQSFATVIKLKTNDNYWRDVEEKLGIKPDDIRAVRDDVLATKIAEKLSLEKSLVKSLVADGYHQHDIAFAAIIGRLSGKEVKAVLDQKRINNSWRDVALMNGVNDRDLHKAMRDVGGPGLGFMNMRREPRGGMMPPPPPPPEH